MSKHRIHATILVSIFPIVCASVNPAGAQQVASNTHAAAERLREYLTRVEQWGFSGAVAVESGGKTILAGGYGWSDSSRRNHNSVETLFDIGSLSKQFTATALLSLVDAGRVDLTVPIGRYFDSVPQDKAAITLHQLLTHTSGMPREVAPDFVALTRSGFERVALAAPLIGTPGTQFSYSNAGYGLIAAIVERVSGLSFQEYVQRTLFSVAGMRQTGFYDDMKRQKTTASIAAAQGSAVDGQSPADWQTTWGNLGSGGVVSSVEDLLAWEHAMRGKRVLTAQSWQRLFTPYNGAYGYGWIIRDGAGGGVTIRHDGAWYAFGSDFRRFPGDSAAIIVLSNRTEGATQLAPPVAQVLQRLLAGDSVPMPPRVASTLPKEARNCAGEYRFAGGGTVAVTAGRSALLVTASGADALLAVNGIVVDASTRDSLWARGDRARTIVVDSWKNDFTLLRKVTAPARATRYVNALEAWRAQRLDSLGALVSVSVIGSLPAAGLPGGWRTFIRLTFSRGSEWLGLTWEAAGTLVRLETGSPQFPEWSAKFRPTDSHDYAAFDLIGGSTVVAKCGGASFDLSSGGTTWRARR